MGERGDDITEVTIRVQKDHVGDLDGIVGRLRSLGLSDVQVLARFLTINGRVGANLIPRLREVDGVASVRESGKFRAL
jgi:hypothetical protein